MDCLELRWTAGVGFDCVELGWIDGLPAFGDLWLHAHAKHQFGCSSSLLLSLAGWLLARATLSFLQVQGTLFVPPEKLLHGVPV